MKKSDIIIFQTINELYNAIDIWEPESADFDCHRYEISMNKVRRSMLPYRNMFYQISLFKQGLQETIVNERSYALDEGTIFFSASGNVQSWEIREDLTGFVMFFSSEFLSSSVLNSRILENFPFFGVDSNIAIKLNSKQFTKLSNIYNEILEEISGDYSGKWEIIHSLLLLIMHQSSKIYYSKNDSEPDVVDSQGYIVNEFQTLLSQHYEQLYLGERIALKIVIDYASDLYIHPNYLNQVTKKVLGKTASSVIKEKTIHEAKILLYQTDFSIAEIAYKLGFETNTYFSRFFKKETGQTPSEYKKSKNI